MKLILLITLLLIIFYQDVRYRAVMWFLFPLLAGACIWYNYEFLEWKTVLFNGLFVVFLLGSLTVYVSIRKKELTAIWKGFFSWGDILFILAVTPLFETIQYIYFFTFGTILTLVIHLSFSRGERRKTIPYAGYLSLVSVAYLVFTEPINHFFLFLNGSR